MYSIEENKLKEYLINQLNQLEKEKDMAFKNQSFSKVSWLSGRIYQIMRIINDIGINIEGDRL